MTHTPDAFVAQNLAAVHSMKRLSLHFFSNMEKLAELNMAASKALMSGSFQHAHSLLDVRQPQQLLDLQMAMITPLAEKAANYGRHVFALVTDTSTELNKATEVRTSQVQKSLADALASLSPHAPETAKDRLTATN